MEKILVSACLLGENCTYKGGNNLQSYLQELNRYYDIVPFCPEVEGGLPTPRKPSESRGSSVYHDDGTDVTKFFHEGAYKATAICSYLGIRLAIMKEASPSCGPHLVYDGYFRDKKIPGEGVAVTALRHIGVQVLNEEEGLALLESLKKNEQIKDEKTRIAKAKEERKDVPEEPREKPARGKPGYSFQGKTRPFANRGPHGRKPKEERKDDSEEPREKPARGKPGYSFQGKTRPFANRNTRDRKAKYPKGKSFHKKPR